MSMKQRLARQEAKGEREGGSDQEKPAIHKIQPIHGTYSLIMVMPKKLTSRLQIKKGDYVKCSISDNKLLIEKVEV